MIIPASILWTAKSSSSSGPRQGSRRRRAARNAAQVRGVPEIRVIGLDAAMGKGENSALVELVAGKARCRVAAASDRIARRLIDKGAYRVIVGTAAFTSGVEQIAAAVGRAPHRCARFEGQDRSQGWQESTDFAAEEVIGRWSYCSGFRVHLRGQGRHDAGHRSRLVPPPARRDQARDHAAGRHHDVGRFRALTLNIHSASEWRSYRRLDLAELARLNL